MYQDGHPLSRVDLVATVHQTLAADGLDVSRFNGHSFQIGAATTTAQVGIPDSVIQSLGRWKSSAFMTYIRTSPQQLTGSTCLCVFIVSCIGCLLVVSASYNFFHLFGSVAADQTIGGCLNTFTPNLQAYGCMWLQAIAHLGWVAVSVIRTARVMGACLNLPSADAYETV